MNGDVHVRFCEGLGVKSPRATRLITPSTGFGYTSFGYTSRRSVEAVSSGSPSREDEDRLLPRLVSARPASSRSVRFLGLHLSASTGQWPSWEVLYRLPTGDQS